MGKNWREYQKIDLLADADAPDDVFIAVPDLLRLVPAARRRRRCVGTADIGGRIIRRRLGRRRRRRGGRGRGAPAMRPEGCAAEKAGCEGAATVSLGRRAQQRWRGRRPARARRPSSLPILPDSTSVPPKARRIDAVETSAPGWSEAESLPAILQNPPDGQSTNGVRGS